MAISPGQGHSLSWFIAEDKPRDGDGLPPSRNSDSKTNAGDEMIERNTGIETETAEELRTAIETFYEDVPCLISEGLEGKWVAFSGSKRLGIADSKQELIATHSQLYSEKKLLVRRVRLQPKEISINF